MYNALCITTRAYGQIHINQMIRQKIKDFRILVNVSYRGKINPILKSKKKGDG